MKQNRKQQSLLDIYDLYYPKIYAYILVRTRHRESTEDIVQQTFVKAAQNLHTFKKRRGATIGSWLFTIAKHTLIDEQKKSSRVSLVEESIMETMTPTSDDALSELIRGEDDEDKKNQIYEMWKVIETLSPEEKEVIRLKYISGLSYEDISSLIGGKPNTLAQILHRALKKCKTAL